MVKIYQKILIAFISFSILFNNSFVSSSTYLNPLNSDSWSSFAGEFKYYIARTPRLLLFNDSVYVVDNCGWIVKFSHESGYKEWELKIKLNFQMESIVIDDENNLYICCKEFYYANNMTLLKIGSNGTIIFSKTFSFNVSYFFEANKYKDDGILIFGKSWTSTFLLKVNKDGTQLWNKILIDYNSRGIVYGCLDSKDNFLFSSSNRSKHFLTKINSSGNIEWETYISDIDYFDLYDLFIDDNDNIFLISEQPDYKTGITKFNSSGNLVDQLLINNVCYHNYLNKFDDLLILVYKETGGNILLRYDSDLNLLWNFTTTDYAERIKRYYSYIFYATDSLNNTYVLFDSLKTSIVKISENGSYISHITRGGGFYEETPKQFAIDSENNIFILFEFRYRDRWNIDTGSNLLVKNPANGGIAPDPPLLLDERDYFLFSILGITLIISISTLIGMIKKFKESINSENNKNDR